MHVSEVSEVRSPRRRLPTLTACAALALASSGVAAAQASAQSIGVTGCVVNTNDQPAQMIVSGTGFAPGDTIELSTTTGGGSGTATSDAGGQFQSAITGPLLSILGAGEQSFTLTATDDNNGATATTTFEAANLAVTTNPPEAKVSRKVSYTFSGFVPGHEIYVHYLHKKKVTATAKFGRAKGACGLLKARAKLYPGKQRFSQYTVQFDQTRHYSAKSLPRVVRTLSIQKL